MKDFDRERGRFRTFLLACLKNYASKERERDRAQKRGGGTAPVSIDWAAAERLYNLEPSHDETPERIYERRWARALLDRVLERLRAENETEEKKTLFEALRPLLTAKKSGQPYAEVAGRLRMTEGAVKVAVHRLRRRYRDLLREEVGNTVAEPSEVEDEIRHLLSVLSG